MSSKLANSLFFTALAAVCVLFLICVFKTCAPSQPKYKVGDCFTDTGEKERWQETFVSKVLDVGKKKYRYAFIGDKHPNIVAETSWSFSTNDLYTYKVECPQILKEYK